MENNNQIQFDGYLIDIPEKAEFESLLYFNYLMPGNSK